MSDLAVVEEKRVLSTEEMDDLIEKCFQFCTKSCGVELYDYQASFARRIVRSVLMGEGEEITALFARQSGKTETVACVAVGLCVLLPTLANIPSLAEDDRIGKYKDGFWVGIFAPTYELGSIMHSRMHARVLSASMNEVLNDPEINMALGKGRNALRMPNGSFVECNSAGPQTHIEGKTYHLILCEETQDISNYKIRKSIHPMGAATNASIVKIGTPNPRRNDFYDACERGRIKASTEKDVNKHTHFEYDYTHAARCNPRYRAYIEKEIGRLGYDSDDFRMSYRLHWLIERGQFIAPEVLDACGISKRDTLKANTAKGARTSFTRPDYPSTQDRSTPNQVASLDIGRTHDSTVLTVARVWWDNPQQVGETPRYYTHIVNWLEIQGDDHEAQYPVIVSFLRNYAISTLIVDSTGRGDPIASRLRADLSGIRVVSFVFTQQSKHRGYTALYQEMLASRITFPAGSGARKMSKYKRFVRQMYELEKHWKGKYLDIKAPTMKKVGRSGAQDRPHDDYADSLMMLCYAVNLLGGGYIETVSASILPNRRSPYSRNAPVWSRRTR